jgi:hypothetical protein
MIASYRCCQRVKASSDICLQPDCDVVVGVDFGGKAVDVDDPRVTARVDTHWVELLQLVTGGDDGIGLVKAEIHVVMAHEANCTECERMVIGHDALAVKRGRNWDVERLGESTYRFRRPASGGPVTGKQDGIARRTKNLCSTLHLGG